MLQPQKIYQFIKTKDKDGKEKIGNCELDPGTQLPKIKTYGWCEACTLSTLAMQKVTTLKNSYLPAYEYDGSTNKLINLCSWKDVLSECYAPYISDINDYSKEDITTTGSPRTTVGLASFTVFPSGGVAAAAPPP